MTELSRFITESNEILGHRGESLLWMNNEVQAAATQGLSAGSLQQSRGGRTGALEEKFSAGWQVDQAPLCRSSLTPKCSGPADPVTLSGAAILHLVEHSAQSVAQSLMPLRKDL